MIMKKERKLDFDSCIYAYLVSGLQSDVEHQHRDVD